MAHEHPREVIVRAIENVSDIVEITDTRGRFEYVNRAFVQKTGYSAEEACGRTPAELLRSGVHEPKYYDEIWRTISAGKYWKGRITSRAKDGSHIIQEAFISPILGDDGEPAHYIAIKRDITERKQLEAQLLEADRLAAVGQLAAGVGHEINNPLAYVLANLRYMRSRLSEFGEGELAREFDELLEETSFGATQIRDIVRDLSAMTQSIDELRPVDVVAAIEFGLRMADNQLRHHVEVDFDFEEVPAVWGNHSRLVQVFLNLIVNAIQALAASDTDENTIRIVVRRDGDEVVVEISDTGVGMSEEEMGHIFEPFYSTKQVGEGSGLGLSICYGIVKNLGGTITVESEQGVGTTFQVCLPIGETDEEESAEEDATFDSRNGTSRCRVLFIDDEPRLLKLVSRLFGNVHDVVTCESGEEALGRMQKEHFDVVVCDVMMPGLSGKDLHERSSAIDPSYPSRFVFITGGAFTDRMEHFLKSVTNPCINKPFAREELLDVINEIARG